MSIDRAALENAIRSLRAYGAGREVEIVIDAAEAHLATLPKTKMVEVWHVEFTVWACGTWEPRIEVCGDGVIAEARAIKKRELNGMSVIKTTGPHFHEVPA